MMLSGPVGLSGEEGIDADELRVGLGDEATRPLAAFFERAIRVRRKCTTEAEFKLQS